MSSVPHGLGDDVESDNEDFKPQVASDSDDEKHGSNKEIGRSPKDEEAHTNGIHDAIGGDEDAADDEDDEGPGEDLGNDEDDDDEEEEEDDEEEIKGHRRKRARGERRNQFVEDEAEVDDEDEELEDEEDDLAEGDRFVADTHPDDVGLDAGADNDDRRHRELDLQRQRLQEEDAEAQAARYKERYGRKQRERGDALVIPKRMLLPSVNDPTIWGIRCKPGKEREIIFGITRRIEHKLALGQPVNITGAFERAGTSTMGGMVYVEARRRVDILEAVENLPNVYPRTKMILIPINEMPDTLKVQPAKTLVPGNYVRIKRGLYKGDLARVTETDTTGLEVDLQVVPRIEYAQHDDTNGPSAGIGPDGAKRKRGFMKSGPRPPQRLFNEQDARKANPRALNTLSSYNQKQFTYMGKTYINGFLEQTWKVRDLIADDVNPTLAEVTMFTSEAEDGTENIDLAAIAQTLKASQNASSYLPGDVVEIYQGESSGVYGKAVGVQGDIVKIRVSDGPLKGQTIESPIKGLRKRFREGDHVKVVGGSKYQDEVGMVVKIKDDRVTILGDSNNQELTVFSKDLRAASDSNITNGSSKFDMYDLVQLDPATVGCVIKIDRESVTVVDQSDSVRTLLLSSVPNRLERRRYAVATDKDGIEVRNDDTVKEVGGEQRTGRVMYIHRTFLFLHNREQVENAGVFVARSSAVLTVAAKGRPDAGTDYSKTNPDLHRGLAAVPNMLPPQTRRGPDRLLNKTVVIRRGKWKGLLGIVKETTQLEARIEIHSLMDKELHAVPREHVVVKDANGNSVDMTRFNGPPMRTGGAGSSTVNPYHSNATPRIPGAAHGAGGWGEAGSRTPAAAAYGSGGMTPGWGSGSKTPMWSSAGVRGMSSGTSFAAGSRTPAAAGGGTSYGGATSYGGTSTWNTGAATPHHHSSGFSGSRTPAAANFAGGKTPMHGSAWDAATPGFAAATPADHPTPRGAAPYGSKNTPAYAADTPFNNARTPGVGGGDEGYE